MIVNYDYNHKILKDRQNDYINLRLADGINLRETI